MVTYAVTLSDLIEKGGAYAGLAAFFGFAVLSVLAFAQAREIRRLRDWAGRAPERAQELEQRVIEQAEQARRVVATPSRRPGEPATAAAQGVVAKPVATPAAEPAAVEAETTAQPAVESETEAEPETETPVVAEEETAAEHEIVAAAPADTAEAPAVDEPAKDEEEEAVPAGAATAVTPAVPAATPANGASGEIPPKLPPRATKGPPSSPVTPKRPVPAPQPLRATQPPSRRPAAVAAIREPRGRRRTPIIVAGIAAGLVLIVVGLLAIFTGGDDSPNKAATPAAKKTPASTASASATSSGKKATGPASRADTKVAVLNGTTVTGLASQVDTALTQAGYTESQKPDDYTDQARSASIVFYNGNENRTAAVEIGKLLDITDRRPIDTAAAQLAPGADVVVVTGADQTP